MKVYDLIVIGGGPAGYNCAEYAAKNGLSTLLVEKENLGGTCLNAGCIPTKTFLYASKMFHYANGAGEDYGVTAQNAAITHSEVVKKKDAVVKTLVQGVAQGLKRCKVEVVNGTGALEKVNGQLTVKVGEETYSGKNVIIATGSVPAVPPIDGVKEGLESGFVVTSNEILQMKELPEKLVIVGGGVIGFEMAAYFQEAGCAVSVVEMLDKVLGPSDREVSSLLQKEMEKKGVAFYLCAAVTSVRDGKVLFTQGGETKEVPCDRVLMCVGRRPESRLEGLEALGVRLQRGAIVTDERMCTNVAGIYAVGDVNGKVMLAHVGYREGEVAVNDILGKKDAMSYDAISSVIYTSPEAAFVGLSEEEARQKGIDFTVKKTSINFSGRHMVENGMSNGICKLLVDNKKQIIIGAALMSSYASEYIYALALMVENQIPVESLKRTIFPHPTVCEIIRETLFS